MNLIDTHGHLNFAALAETWPAIVKRSQERGITEIVIPGSQKKTSLRAVEQARQYPDFLFAAVGLHPTHIRPWAEYGNPRSKNGDQEDERFEDFDYQQYLELARLPEVVAIGEIGLDCYRVPEIGDKRLEIRKILEEQERVLLEFIRLTQAVGKPMILHCRGTRKPELGIMNQELGTGTDPHERLIQILGAIPESLRPRFVIHCYQGTVEQVEQYLKLGGLISFTGTITYSDDPAIGEVVRAVPLDRLMVETDSPYLSPVPYRGESNEPWKVIEVARRIAELQNISLEKVAEQTSATARHFFHLLGNS